MTAKTALHWSGPYGPLEVRWTTLRPGTVGPQITRAIRRGWRGMARYRDAVVGLGEPVIVGTVRGVLIWSVPVVGPDGAPLTVTVGLGTRS